ncbi:MAG: cobalamin-dependent protein, partial [Candidatus Erginobacter occultus]|nr:cobalamin-dependent protein [Candidatus Erginobacter occultus]
MRVLFINKFLDKHTIYREPLGIMSLASAISPIHKVFILEPTRENIFRKIENIKPHIIAYSLRSGYHQYYIDLNTILKKKYGFISVFGGSHPTFFPEMINEDGVDCVCRGEAEEAFLEFLDLLEAKKDITKIKNFWIKKANQIYKNPCRPLVQNLDKLKFPSRSIFDDYPEIS